MIQSLERFVPARLRQAGFVRQLATLSSGTILGQGALVVSSPFLTRLFTPTEFGLLSVFTALSAILGNVMALRYEFAIPVARTDEDAAAIAAVGITITATLSLVIAAVLWQAGSAIGDLLGTPELTPFFWMLPFILAGFGFSYVLAYWSVRRGTFAMNARSTFLQFMSQAVLQLLFGVLRWGGFGLLLGYSLGPVVRCLSLVTSLPRRDRELLRAVRGRRMLELAREHWRYPVFSSSSTLLQSLSQMLPAVLAAVLFGPAVAGFFGLTQRILGLPVRVLSEAASDVFLAAVAKLDGPRRYRLFTVTAVRFLALGTIGSLPVLVAGPELFALVFGPVWHQAGEIAQILAPLYLARFVVVPISQILNVVGRQDRHLASAVLNVSAMAASFTIGGWLQLSSRETFILYSAGSSAAFLFYFFSAWQMARAGRHHDAAPATS